MATYSLGPGRGWAKLLCVALAVGLVLPLAAAPAAAVQAAEASGEGQEAVPPAGVGDGEPGAAWRTRWGSRPARSGSCCARASGLTSWPWRRP